MWKHYEIRPEQNSGDPSTRHSGIPLVKIVSDCRIVQNANGI